MTGDGFVFHELFWSGDDGWQHHDLTAAASAPEVINTAGQGFACNTRFCATGRISRHGRSHSCTPVDDGRVVARRPDCRNWCTIANVGHPATQSIDLVPNSPGRTLSRQHLRSQV